MGLCTKKEVSSKTNRVQGLRQCLSPTVETAIAEIQAEIEGLKLQLREEKIKRKYKEEYDTLAKIINESPSRADTLRYLSSSQCLFVPSSCMHQL